MAGFGGGEGRTLRAVLAEAGGAGGGVRGGGRAARRSDSGGTQAVPVGRRSRRCP